MDKVAIITFFVPLLVTFLFLLLSYVFSPKKRSSQNTLHGNKTNKLPPGSMGWPYIGETLKLYSQQPHVFFSNRQTSYGEIFKTRIFGSPTVMLASPEAVRFVLVNRADSFKPTFPKTKESLIGPSALNFHQGAYHTRLRKLVMGPFYPEALRKLVPAIQGLALSALASCADGRLINTFTEMKKLSFEVGVLIIFGHLESRYKEELKKNYSVVDRGYNSFAIDLPGTRYRKALKARKRLTEILRDITRQRNNKGTMEDSDLLSCLLNSNVVCEEGNDLISEEQISDNIIGLLFAAQDTTASAMTWIVKYLHECPSILEAVKAEQKEIYRSNGKGERHLTWNQTRNMPLTNKVIMESMRIASIISFTFREAVTDVEYKGFLIPKGWKVMPLFRNIHHNPNFFADPQKFDPSRFEDAPKPNTFMPFGNGVHSCLGNELAKLEMLIMVHHLTSQFRCELVGSGDEKGGVEYGPFPVPLRGLQARLWRHDET